jgi:hypothetical protein
VPARVAAVAFAIALCAAEVRLCAGTETIPEMGDGERCVGQARVLAVRKFAGATYLWTRFSFLYCLCFVIFGCAAGAIAEDVFIFI